MKLIQTLMVLVLGFGLAQTDHSGMNHGGMAMQSMTELSRLSGRDYDIAYMSMMIDHHKGAVEMAQAVSKVGKDARILKAATAIVAVQTKEIAQLTGWLRGWYGVAPSQRYMTMMRSDMQSMMDTAMMGMMPGHSASPDKKFLEGMIPHHQDAVNMSQSCLKSAAKVQLKRFCQEVIRVQNSEIAQYKSWLQSLK